MKELSPTGYYHTWKLPQRFYPKLKKVESKESIENAPPDWEKGFEYYRHYKVCRCCHDWKHEDDLILTDSGGFICKECNSKIDQLINRL